MKKTRDFTDVMKKLYVAAGKYIDKELVDAVTEVSDLVREYKSIIDSYETHRMNDYFKDSLKGEENMKIYYTIEEQLDRIAEETDFELSKPVDMMTEEEIIKAENDASQYVEWVKDDEYIQLVPKSKANGKMIYPL